ncbi:MAG: PHP domain-containing protein [Clostridia bacterium]|nr:PHP domain-containing protein [Clostridia bacterium]
MFFYETHQHTAACSKCAHVEAAELVKCLAEGGYAGVILTNHFYNGNTAIDRNLPWKEFCEAYEKDYEVAKEEAKKYDFDVLFGVEEHVGKGKEVLIYGLSPDNLKKHPELVSGNLETIYNVVHKYAGLVIQAHPFRDRAYITDPFEKLPTEYLDGFEVYNRANPDLSNNQAYEYVKDLGKIITAGSDSHNFDEDYYRFGIGCEHRIRNEKELVTVLKNRDYVLINERKD